MDIPSTNYGWPQASQGLAAGATNIIGKYMETPKNGEISKYWFDSYGFCVQTVF